MAEMDEDFDGPTLPMGSAAASGSAMESVGIDDGMLELLRDDDCGGALGSGTSSAAPAISEALPPMPPPLAPPDDVAHGGSLCAPMAATRLLSSDASGGKFKRSSTQALDFESNDEASTQGADAGDAQEQAAMLVSINSATASDVTLNVDLIACGRAEGVGIQLTDLRVSAEQFVIRRKPGAGDNSFVYELEDRSRNGTLVSKKTVKGCTVLLNDRDLIEVLPVTKVGKAESIAFRFYAPVAKGVAAAEAVVASPAAKRPRLADDTSVPACASSSKKEVASLFEGATCTICQEVLHRATSVQPCLHSFCSACLGGWLRRPSAGKRACPLCRKNVTGVARNHTLDGLIAGLVKAHPGHERTKEQLAELDAKDSLHKADYDLGRLIGVHAASGGPMFGLPSAGLFGVGADGDSNSSASSSAEEDDEDAAAAPCFHCGAPSWRSLSNAAVTVAANPAMANDLKLEAFSGNVFERDVLEEVLRSQGTPFGTVLANTLESPSPPSSTPVRLSLERGTGEPILPPGSWSDTVACRSCALGVLRGLVYSLRERMPETALPARARGRGNCWYGRACRTMGRNPSHAQRLNHICEQTRFH